MSALKLDLKAKFNALANARHVFSFKEDGTVFQILEVVNLEDCCKAVVVDSDGVIEGLYTDSQSAKNALNEVFTIFGADQPFIKINIKETAKKQSVYFVEVQ